MESIMQNSIKQIHVVIAICFSLLVVGLCCLNAAETFTNWNGFTLELIIPQTNLVAGGNIPASIVVSNALDTDCHIPWSKNLCSCGFAEFSIFEMISGKNIDCNLSTEGRMFHSFSLGTLTGHQSQSFQFDLGEGYALTNAGVFIVQVKGWLPYRESPKQRSVVLTPPIFLQLSPKPETNAPPK
jgi:hypothetical protein